jgi:sigma-E factor negative regulatory protein RseA
MTPDVRENLSAGIDGELSKEQLRFLLRRLDHDTSLQYTWVRYHIARDGLRRQLPPLAGPDFSARVLLAIAQEPALALRSRPGPWLRWSAGGAIAASVAVAALMIGRPVGDSELGVTAASHRAGNASLAATAARLATPAAVPPWLSGNSAGMLSQQAAATFGAPLGRNQPLTSYPPLHRYRTLENSDGSYLLLLDPGQQPTPSRQAAAAQ